MHGATMKSGLCKGGRVCFLCGTNRSFKY